MVTLSVILVLAFLRQVSRLWAPLVGILVGFFVAWPLSLVDFSGVSEAAGWVFPINLGRVSI